MVKKYERTDYDCIPKVLECLSSRQWCNVFLGILSDGNPNSVSGTKIGMVFRKLGLDDNDAKFLAESLYCRRKQNDETDTRPIYNYYD